MGGDIEESVFVDASNALENILDFEFRNVGDVEFGINDIVVFFRDAVDRNPVLFNLLRRRSRDGVLSGCLGLFAERLIAWNLCDIGCALAACL